MCSLSALSVSTGISLLLRGTLGLAVTAFVVFICVAGIVSLMTVAFLYNLEDWDDDPKGK